MMKNKKMLYVLVPATLFIWGAIGFNIFSHLNSGNSIPEVAYLPLFSSGKDSTQGDYTLLADYPDPFLKVSRINTSMIEKETPVEKTRQNNVSSRTTRLKRRIQWPSVEYKGLIINEDKEVALIKIDDRNQLLNVGQTSKEVTVIALFPDSVILQFSEELKTFPKN